MTRLLTKFRTHFVLVLFTAFVGFAHAETPLIDSTTVDSAAVDTAPKLSPFDHLGHNMLLSAFGWPLGAFHDQRGPRSPSPRYSTTTPKVPCSA